MTLSATAHRSCAPDSKERAKTKRASSPGAATDLFTSLGIEGGRREVEALSIELAG